MAVQTLCWDSDLLCIIEDNVVSGEDGNCVALSFVGTKGIVIHTATIRFFRCLEKDKT